MEETAAGRRGAWVAVLILAALLGGAALAVARRRAVVGMFEGRGRAALEVALSDAETFEVALARRALSTRWEAVAGAGHADARDRLLHEVDAHAIRNVVSTSHGFIGEKVLGCQLNICTVTTTAVLTSPKAHADFPLARVTVSYGLAGRFSLSPPRATIAIEEGIDSTRVAEEIRAGLDRVVPGMPIEVVRRAP